MIIQGKVLGGIPVAKNKGSASGSAAFSKRLPVYTQGLWSARVSFFLPPTGTKCVLEQDFLTLLLLTPKGLEEKVRVTYSFLKTKQREYERIKAEIDELKEEVSLFDNGITVSERKRVTVPNPFTY